MRTFGKLLLAAVVAGLVSFVAAPVVAFFAIRSAADARDTEALVRLVDYAALRRTLRPQLTPGAQARAPAPSFIEDPLGAVRRRLEREPATPADVDSYLTPSALAALTRGGARSSNLTGWGSDEPGGDPLPKPTYWGVDRVRLAVDGTGGGTVFTFERRGLFEWRLAYVGLPRQPSARA